MFTESLQGKVTSESVGNRTHQKWPTWQGEVPDKYWTSGRIWSGRVGGSVLCDLKFLWPTCSSQEWVRAKHFCESEINIFKQCRQEGIKGRAGTSSTHGQDKPPGDAANARSS